MTISELVEALEKIKDKEGDIDVMFDSPLSRMNVEDIDTVEVDEFYSGSKYKFVRIGWSGIE